MDMTKIPYTEKDIVDYLLKALPDQGGDVEAWVKGRFEDFKQSGRKLPETIKIITLRKNWIPMYKWRGRNGVRFDRGRVFKNEKGLQ